MTSEWLHLPDDVRITNTPTGLAVFAQAVRGGPSYNYRLELSAKQLLECLFQLPPDKIASAMEELRDGFNFAKVIPELQKQLAAGALQSQSCESEDEDDEDDSDD